jgi:hypothetical protein
MPLWQRRHELAELQPLEQSHEIRIQASVHARTSTATEAVGNEKRWSKADPGRARRLGKT